MTEEKKHSELLCFITDKRSILALDSLVKICVDFYNEDEIFAARDLLDLLLSARLPRRKSPDKLRATVEDIVKALLNPSTDLPIFYAVNIARLPPVDAKHCDMSAVLMELQGLRKEVRDIQKLQEEVCVLRQQLADMVSIRGEVDSLKQLTSCIVQSSVSTAVDTGTDQASSSHQATATDASSFASVANELWATGMKKKTTKCVVGKSTTNVRVKPVITKRSIDIFVSRLHPATDTDDIVSCVTDILPNTSVDDICCTRLKSRYELLYSSFHVCVTVDAVNMKTAIDKLMSDDLWPEGLLVRRYFKPKDGTRQ